MKTLKIEWRHLEVEGETCNRCYDTGENINAEVKRLNRALEQKSIKIEWFETKLDDSLIGQSNAVLFNGVPIEEIISIKVSQNYCESCTDLLGDETYCRTIIYEGAEYEDIPAKAIREAALKVLDLLEPKTIAKSNCCRDDNSGCCC